MNINSVVSIGILFSSLKDEVAFAHIHSYVHSQFKYYEIIIIANPSDSFPGSEEAILSQANTRLVVLNDNAPDDILRKKIFELAIGDFVVLYDPNEAETELIGKTIQSCLDGHDFTSVEYKSTEISIYAKVSTLLFWCISKLCGLTINSRLSNTGCYSRNLVTVLNASETGQNYFRFLLATAGFSGVILKEATRENRSFLYILKRVGKCLDIIGSAPYRLLMITSWLSLAACLGNILYLFYVLSVWFFMPHVQPGWTTTSLTQSVLWAVIFFALFVYSCIFSAQIGKTAQNRFVVASDVSRSEFITSLNELNVTDKQ